MISDNWEGGFGFCAPVRRMRPYFQNHSIVVRTDFPVVKILSKPDLAGQMIGWSVEIFEYGIRYELRGSIKSQHLIDFL